MLKVYNVVIDGEKFQLREPRIADYMAAKGKDNEGFMIAMLSGMLLTPGGDSVGEAAVLELPLRVLNGLTSEVDKIVNAKADPLATNGGSSIG